MSTTVAQLSTPAETSTGPDEPELAGQVDALVASLRHTFGIEFTIFRAADGEVLHKSEEQPVGDITFRSELARAVAHRDEPAFLGDEDPVLLFALPLTLENKLVVVAVGTFVTRHVSDGDNIDGIAKMLWLPAPKVAAWIAEQECWSGRQLNAVGHAVLDKQRAEAKANKLNTEVVKVSENLASTYEEISVLYGVTQNLQLSSTDEELGRMALDWLGEVIPANGLAIQYLPSKFAQDISSKARRHPVLLTSGDCPVDLPKFEALEKSLDLNVNSGPVVINAGITNKPDWQFDAIQQLIVVPLAQGDNVYGWLAAFNHNDDAEFGTVEASLMSSVGAVLGIHSGNIDLYRRQSDFLAQMVRALTSAIDAKDPYTCGHSDRVARVSVRLGQELGCDVHDLNRLYMGGLLHDIGKIGIDDNVLRKPGRLTPAEFEHIKLHPELGYNILRDVRQLQDVLPLVLHHHEAWDGSGYPHALAGEDIPYLARIAAVADSFDAMSSDRPYRQGMADAKVDAIFRDGSGAQWDAAVVDAFFAARDDIRHICRDHRADLSLDVQQWL